jgi:leucine-rich repeat protein SHOC2
MEDGRVVKLVLVDFGLTGAVPAEIGQLTSLRRVAPPRQSADELAGGDRAAHVADGVGSLDNKLTSLPAEIGQLTSLRC